MGFYGNITSATKTGFSFDKTYPNRTEMEINMKSDGVYIGRFVLVDYDQDSENVRRAYFNLELLEEIGNGVKTYLYSDASLIYKIQFNSTGIIVDENNLVTGVNKDDILYLRLEDGSKDFFICIGEHIEYGSDGISIVDRYAEFKRFTQGPDYEGIYRWNYAVNYNTDQTNYGDKYSTSIGRGWDSTVWQKVYENGAEKYVMVAELNGVVPTFTISADAPTMTPAAPHFDEISNNTYYELHAQPQWGMRVRHANGFLSERLDGTNYGGINYNIPSGLSDVEGFWIQPVYNKELDITQYYYLCQENEYGEPKWKLVDLPVDPETNIVSFDDAYEYISKQKNALQPLGIYFNKEGFDPIAQFESETPDSITVLPTGYSQTPVFIKNQETGEVEVKWKTTEYNDHTKGTSSPKIDTLEWEILLPSLGNAVNEMWDLVYGVGSNGKGDEVYQYDEKGEIVTRPNGRPKGVNNKKRQTFVDWVDGDDFNDSERLRLVKERKSGNGFNYEPKQVETLAGCLNSVHDLMGMIIVDKSDLDLTDNNAVQEFIKKTDADKIYYFNDGGYYRRGIGYKYTTLNYKYEKVEVTEDEYQENFYYYLKPDGSYGQDLNNSFDSTKEYYVKKINDPEVEYTRIELDQYEPYQYYYLSGDDYKNEINPIARNVQYYRYSGNIKTENNISMDFIKGKYWELLDNGNYQPTNDEVPDQDNYYIINNDKTLMTHILDDPRQYDEKNETYQGKVLSYFWSPGAFAVKSVLPDGTVTYRLTDMDSEYDPALQYYMLDFARTTNVDASTGEVYYIPEIKKAYKVNLIKIGDNKYYRQVYSSLTGKYTYFLATQEIIDEEYKDLGRRRLDPANGYPDEYVPNFGKNNYYTLNDIDIYSQNKFYVTNKYYYIDEDNNYIKDKSLKYDAEKTYYTLLENSFIPVRNEFYIPNKYYQQHIDETTGNTYYVLDKSFTKNELPYYERNYFYIQSDLQGLYAVGSQWNKGIQEIPCTIELASIKEVYEMKLLNGFARTFNTIHGLIIGINQILLSGDYNTRDRNTVQGCINLMNDMINRFDEFLPTRFLISDNYGRIASADRETNEWIDIDIIGDPGKPKIRIEHTYPHEKEDTLSQLNINDSDKDTVELETVILDATGHVTNVNTEIVTLPYGYKTFTDGTNNAIAANTQDTFTFADDTWVSATINNKTLQIAHEDPNEATSTIGETQNKGPNFGETFKTLYLGIDNKGHIKVSNERIITLPKGSLSNDFVNDDSARVLTGIGFNPSLGKISYSQNNVGNLLLTDYIGGSSEEVNASDTINQAFSKLQTNLNSTNTKLNQEVQNLTNSINSTEETLTNNINSVETTLNNSISAVDTKVDTNQTNTNTAINNLDTKVNSNQTTLSNQISGLDTRVSNNSTSITQIRTALGATEADAAITSVAEQIAAALEDFKTNVLKDYATKEYVDNLVNPSVPPESA